MASGYEEEEATMVEADRIECVCFDAGGVVVRICRSWAEGCEAAGIELRGVEEREHTAGTRRRIIEAYQKGEIDCESFSRGVSEAVGGIYTPEEIMRVHRAWILGEYDGIRETVSRIHRVGLGTAMLSNTNHAHWEQMHETGRFPGFLSIRNRHASHLLGLHKPDSRIYDELSKRLGIPGKRILFFDDLSENVEAAKRSGWHSIQIDPFADPAQQIERSLADFGFKLG